MTKTEYKSYLQSPEWKETRKAKIEEMCGICERCMIPRWLAELVYDQDLHVHHLNYANKGSERSEDLQVLCRRCHEVETFGRSELKAPKTATCEACKAIHWDYRSSLCAICAAVFIDEGFSGRLGVPDPTYPEHLRFTFWHSIAGSLAYMCRNSEALVEVLTLIAATYVGRGRTDRRPEEVRVDFDAALSLVDFGRLKAGFQDEDE